MAYNKTILQGNLTRDVEIRYAQAGTAIGNTSIAVSHKYKTKAGEQKEETLFIDIIAFGRTAEIMNQYVRKGSKVLVDGRLKLEQWEDKNSGGKRSKHTLQVENFQMLDSKQDGQQQGQPQQGYQQQQPQQGYPQPTAPAAYPPPVAQAQPTAQPLPAINVSEEKIPF